jgi:hypothetical protein
MQSVQAVIIRRRRNLVEFSGDRPGSPPPAPPTPRESDVLRGRGRAPDLNTPGLFLRIS